MPSMEEYTRVEWQDLPSKETPVNAENLNNMDNAIYSLYGDVAALEQRFDELGVSDASENTVTFDDDPSEPTDLVTSPATLASLMTGIYSRVKYLLDEIVTFALKDDFDIAVSNFALVEQNAVASGNYAIGDYLIRNNKLYRVKAVIEPGDQFSSDNIEETTVGDEIKSVSSSGSGNMASYPGMIIHSTTLSTKAAVIEQYGGTDWILHDGYFLRGSSLGNVTAYTAQSDGGSDSHNHSGSTGSVTLTAAQCAIPGHTHPPASSNTWFQCRPQDTTSSDSGSAMSGSGYKYPRSQASGWTGDATTGYASKATASSGHSHTISSTSHIPTYKNVYIWERIS